MSGSPHLPDVDAIVVNRDGGGALFRALASLERQTGAAVSLLVVDNASRPDERARISQEAPAARVVGFSRNLGFAGGANEGIARTRSRFVLLLNNDAVLEPDYVARLARYVDERIRAAADSTPTGDSLRLAVLAALNIADELYRCRERDRARDGELAERAGEIERILDRILIA